MHQHASGAWAWPASAANRCPVPRPGSGDGHCGGELLVRGDRRGGQRADPVATELDGRWHTQRCRQRDGAVGGVDHAADQPLPRVGQRRPVLLGQHLQRLPGLPRRCRQHVDRGRWHGGARVLQGAPEAHRLGRPWVRSVPAWRRRSLQRHAGPVAPGGSVVRRCGRRALRLQRQPVRCTGARAGHLGALAGRAAGAGSASLACGALAHGARCARACVCRWAGLGGVGGAGAGAGAGGVCVGPGAQRGPALARADRRLRRRQAAGAGAAERWRAPAALWRGPRQLHRGCQCQQRAGRSACSGRRVRRRAGQCLRRCPGVDVGHPGDRRHAASRTGTAAGGAGQLLRQWRIRHLQCHGGPHRRRLEQPGHAGLELQQRCAQPAAAGAAHAHQRRCGGHQPRTGQRHRVAHHAADGGPRDDGARLRLPAGQRHGPSEQHRPGQLRPHRAAVAGPARGHAVQFAQRRVPDRGAQPAGA
jgi:hypothetical protein